MELLTQTVAFPETLDERAIDAFHAQIKGAIAAPATVILIDFQTVEFISSPGLMTLVVAFKRVREAGKKVLLCSVNEQVKMLLELTGMDQVFELIDHSESLDNHAEIAGSIR